MIMMMMMMMIFEIVTQPQQSIYKYVSLLLVQNIDIYTFIT
jgi:hypothetical protein